jgi:hypothetical protein
MPVMSVLAVVLAGLSVHSTSSEDVIRLKNVTIDMIGHFSRGAVRVEARITNPMISRFTTSSLIAVPKADGEVRPRSR